MQRIAASYHIENIDVFKLQMLNWANRFSICCFMNTNNYEDKFHNYECIAAVECYKKFLPGQNLLIDLDKFYKANDDWIFGHLAYDLKNEIEQLHSSHTNKTGFADAYFFIPEVVLTLVNNELKIFSITKQPHEIFIEINKTESAVFNNRSEEKIEFQASIPKDDYLKKIKALKHHIKIGDCYEINFCQEFFAENAIINPLEIFIQLIRISPTPFSCFYKLNNKYVLCASPERFLSKRKNIIFSQPVKGTAARNTNHEADELSKNELLINQKEKSENVMIVDLVRNDLSKICEEGSVEMDELFGVYTFPQVHQMISTIKGTLQPNISFADVLKATFPMGSMTGAPKYKVMQLIDQYEVTKRELFSGSIGYISPEKDFDFNVVIRSIFYNATNNYLNYLVGSAITFYSDAEKEYEECLLKAAAIKALFE